MSNFIQAVRDGDLEKVKLLLPISDPSENNSDAIRWASYNGHLEVVKLLLSDPRVDSSDVNTAIRYASSNGRTEIVKFLLADPRVDPSANNSDAIRWASNNGHLEVVKLLLSDPRVDSSYDINAAIRYASSNGHTEIVKLLLSDPRVDWRGIDEKMKIKLLKDADIDLKDQLKASLLTINRITPKMQIDKEPPKTLIPKSVRKNIIYRAPYEELCSLIKGEIPPIKLVALANY